jgi:RNA polymerase sigma-70 factor (ECF subfamily)
LPELATYTDESLVALMKEGNQAAFTALYERYWKKMVVQAYMKVQRGEDAKEIVQDVFLDLWNRRSKLELEHSFHTYVAAAVKYRILRWLAKEKNEQFKRSKLSVADNDSTTQEWLDFQHLRQELEKAVQQLPDKCQLVFRLSREAGLSDKEIAQELQISPKTVETHLSRALKSLRTSFRHFFSLLG